MISLSTFQKNAIKQIENHITNLKMRLKKKDLHPINRDKVLAELLDYEQKMSKIREDLLMLAVLKFIQGTLDAPEQGGVKSLGDGSHGGSHQI